MNMFSVQYKQDKQCKIHSPALISLIYRAWNMEDLYVFVLAKVSQAYCFLSSKASFFVHTLGEGHTDFMARYVKTGWVLGKKMCAYVSCSETVC